MYITLCSSRPHTINSQLVARIMQYLTLPQLLGLGVFASYFGLIFILLAVILRSLPSLRMPHVSKGRVYSFIVLTLISFAHTWFCESASRIIATRMLILQRYVFIHARKYLCFRAKARPLRHWFIVEFCRLRAIPRRASQTDTSGTHGKLAHEHRPIRTGVEDCMFSSAKLVVERTTMPVYGRCMDGFLAQRR